MNERLLKILSLVLDAAKVVGNDHADRLLDIIKVSAQGYTEISGKPVDPDLVPEIQKIA
jgi:hypothetical protein